MRRHLSLAVASAILGLAVAGFLGGPGPASAAAGTTTAPRTVSSPLVDMEAVPATTPRIDSYEGRLRLLAPRTAELAVLLLSGVLALTAAAYVGRARRRIRALSLPAWSASLRGPPRLAAL